MCIPCKSEYYSLRNDSKCATCPSEDAICPGGNKVIAKQGYWRRDADTPTVLKCPIERACPGDRVDVHNQCARGYQGVLCATCDPKQNYGSAPSGNFCVDCSQMRWYHFISGPLLAMIKWIVLVYTLHTQLVRNSEIAHGLDKRNTIRAAILFKILLNYFQMINIVFSLPLEEQMTRVINGEQQSQSWLDRQILTILRLVRGSDRSEVGFSWDCFIRALPWLDDKLSYLHFTIYNARKQSYETPWFHFTFEVYSLVIVALIYFILWVLIHRARETLANAKAIIYGTLVTILFNAMPNLQQAVFSYMQCVNIGDKHKPRPHLKGNYNHSCSTDVYVWKLWVFVIPIALIFLIIAPTLIALRMRSVFRRGKQESVYNIMTLGFLYYGYRSNVYFWEILNGLRKILLISLIVYMSRYSSQLQVLSVMLVIQLAYAAQLEAIYRQ
eukprot:TRINITY_DN1736_c0_g3_i2.p1 TRINITY_DN1736_c0_g3~~TRINITY_DN1736_c0_g3_i2.p1  ORF type:complete len:441 (+),score=30.47 TRINITY_DN1736_c0_g3_i2:1-1323(+)